MMDAVVQRLDADAVTNEPELAFLCVPEANREHTAEAVNAIDPPLLKCVQDYLSISMGRKLVAGQVEFAPNVLEIVYFAVANDGDRLVLVEHRLGSARWVDDAEALVAKPHGLIEEEPAAVGPAVRECLDYPVEVLARPVVSDTEDDARDAAHLVESLRDDERRAAVVQQPGQQLRQEPDR